MRTTTPAVVSTDPASNSVSSHHQSCRPYKRRQQSSTGWTPTIFGRLLLKNRSSQVSRVTRNSLQVRKPVREATLSVGGRVIVPNPRRALVSSPTNLPAKTAGQQVCRRLSSLPEIPVAGVVVRVQDSSTDCRGDRKHPMCYMCKGEPQYTCRE